MPYALTIAATLGVLQLIAPKGTSLHRAVGYGWVALMTGLSLFWLRAHGAGAMPRAVGFAGVLAVPAGLFFAQNNRMRAHAVTMVALFVALLLAGGATLLAAAPPR